MEFSLNYIGIDKNGNLMSAGCGCCEYPEKPDSQILSETIKEVEEFLVKLKNLKNKLDLNQNL